LGRGLRWCSSRRSRQASRRVPGSLTYRRNPSSLGSYRLHRPPGDRKSGIPESVDTPAPENTTIRSASASNPPASSSAPVARPAASMQAGYRPRRIGPSGDGARPGRPQPVSAHAETSGTRLGSPVGERSPTADGGRGVVHSPRWGVPPAVRPRKGPPAVHAPGREPPVVRRLREGATMPGCVGSLAWSLLSSYWASDRSLCRRLRPQRPRRRRLRRARRRGRFRRRGWWCWWNGSAWTRRWP